MGIERTPQEGVEGLYLLFNIGKAASSLAAIQKNSDHIMHLPMKAHIPQAQKILGSVADT